MGNALPELVTKSSEQNGDSSETESDSGEETPKPDNSWQNMVLKSLGIHLQFTSREDSEVVANCRLEKWSVDKRNTNLDRILSAKEEFICSDIYEVKGSKFKVDNDVTVTVTLGKDISPKRHKIQVKKMVGGKWLKGDAEISTARFSKKCKAIFKTKELEEFVIIGCLKFVKVKISPAGTKVKVDESSKMAVDIPAGAVETDQDMDFKIIPPDANAITNYLQGSSPFCKAVASVTECLYGNSPKALTFKKPVTVQLPLDDKSQERPNTTLVLFRMAGNEVKMLDRSTQFALSKDGICNLQVSSFSGYCAAKVHTEQLNNVQAIQNEMNLLYGKNNLATILVFRETKIMAKAHFPRLWVELVDKPRVEETVKKRTKRGDLVEIPNSRSHDIKVHDDYRMKLELTGDLKGVRDIPKSFYLITYLGTSDDNHKLFPVEKKESPVSSIGIINFFCDRICIHSVQMDTAALEKPFVNRSPSVTSNTGSMEYASGSIIGNDDMSLASAKTLQRQNSVTSIGSAASLLSQAPLCKALNEVSLFNMAGMMTGADDGFKLSVHLGMTDDFDKMSQGSNSQRQANFKLLKEWTRRQTTLDEALQVFLKGLKAVKLTKVEKAFKKALQNKSEV